MGGISEDEARREAIAAYERYEEVARAMRENLERNEPRLRRHKENLAAGQHSSVFQLPHDELPVNRNELTQRIADLERARWQVRQAIANLALAEGRSLSEVARQWGVSRQYLWKITRSTGEAEPEPQAAVDLDELG